MRFNLNDKKLTHSAQHLSKKKGKNRHKSKNTIKPSDLTPLDKKKPVVC